MGALGAKTRYMIAPTTPNTAIAISVSIGSRQI
jgi:hypothetical protein